MLATIRPALASEIPRLAEFMASRLKGAGGPARYRRYLEYRWAVDRPDLGIVIEDGGEIHGFIGAIYSDRLIADRVHRFCNLTSIAVDESHRKQTLTAFSQLFKRKDTTFTAFSASDSVQKILDFFKFAHRPGERAIVPITGAGIPRRVLGRVKVTTDLDRIIPALGSAERKIAVDHGSYRCAQILIERGDRRSLVIAIRRGRGIKVFADVLYASDRALLVEELGAVQPSLVRSLGTLLVGIDQRWMPVRPRLSFVYAKLRPTYARSPVLRIDDVDLLYSELVAMSGDR